MKKIICYLLLTAVAPVLPAQQIVNIEGKRFEDPVRGWQGNIEFSYSQVQVQNSLIQMGNKFAVVRSDSLKNLLFFNDLNIVNANGENLLSSGYQHFRYVRNTDSILKPEGYLQTQFNRQLSIDFRFLAGGGARLRLIRQNNFFAYAGTSMMYEYEKIPHADAWHTIRNNTYLSLDFKKISQLPLNLVFYFQPNMLNTSDYRLANEIRLLFKNETNFMFRVNLQTVYDTHPPPGVSRDYYNFTTGVNYTF